jgi:hypothetical protein
MTESICSMPSPKHGLFLLSVKPEFTLPARHCPSKVWFSLREVQVLSFAHHRPVHPQFMLGCLVGPTKTSASFANVDMYDAASGTWSSTYRLSLPRTILCGTSLTKLGIAIFAGGGGVPSTKCIENFNVTRKLGTTTAPFNNVDFFYAKDPAARRWTTGQLSVARWALSCGALSSVALAFFAGGQGVAVLNVMLFSISLA